MSQNTAPKHESRVKPKHKIKTSITKPYCYVLHHNFVQKKLSNNSKYVEDKISKQV